MPISVGDWVIPDADTDFSKWDKLSKLRVISVTTGTKSTRRMITAVDEHGINFIGTDNCFKKVKI